MSNVNQDALEHLRIIRSLMERAHVYRALSAPAALAGGFLGLGATAIHFASNKTQVIMTGGTFISIWLGILFVATVINLALLGREAVARGQSMWSEGMRTACRALGPPLVTGGVLGVGLAWARQELVLASLLWVIFYGLALLATADFSPRSLLRLGWAFLGSGVILAILWMIQPHFHWRYNETDAAIAVMGGTFGFLHLFYGTAIFISRRRGEEDPIE